MCYTLVLQQPNFVKKFYLQTNTSAYGVGAILSQERELSPLLAKFKKLVIHPVAFFSATFMPTK
jgi:hypothetical protein